MITRIGKWFYYLLPLGRHWTAGLPDHIPNLDDPDIKRARAIGQESIQIHQERLAHTSTGDITLPNLHRELPDLHDQPLYPQKH